MYNVICIGRVFILFFKVNPYIVLILVKNRFVTRIKVDQINFMSYLDSVV